MARRRTHLGESLVFMGAGIVIGGTAAVLLAGSRKKDVIAWLSRKAKETVDDVEETAETMQKEGPESSTDESQSARSPEPIDAVV